MCLSPVRALKRKSTETFKRHVNKQKKNLKRHKIFFVLFFAETKDIFWQ